MWEFGYSHIEEH